MQYWDLNNLSPELTQLIHQLSRTIEKKNKFELAHKAVLKNSPSSINFILIEKRKGVIYAGG